LVQDNLDGGAMSLLDNTPVGIANAYKYDLMFDSVRVSDNQVNFVYTSDTSPYNYGIVKITIENDAIVYDNTLSSGVTSGVGLSQVSLLGDNMVTSQGAEWHTIISTGAEPVTNDYLYDGTSNEISVITSGDISSIYVNNVEINNNISNNGEFNLIYLKDIYSENTISTDVDFTILRNYKYDVECNLIVNADTTFEFISGEYNGLENDGTTSITFEVSGGKIMGTTFEVESNANTLFEVFVNTKIE